eukprot:tig00000042_g15484.t1
MPILTLISRVSDALPLAASMDDEKEAGKIDLESYKTQAKKIFKSLSNYSDPRCTIDAGQFTFHYLIDGGVAYLVLTDKVYPRKLAFSYLEELSREFFSLYGQQVEAAQRPYAFISFDKFIQKSKKLYQDSRSQRNLEKLNEELRDVHRIMTKNIEEVLGRGEKLDTVSQRSSMLAGEAKKYAKQAKYMNTQLFIRTYGPLAVIVLICILILYFRFFR